MGISLPICGSFNVTYNLLSFRISRLMCNMCAAIAYSMVAHGNFLGDPEVRLGMFAHWKKGTFFVPFGIFRYCWVEVIILRHAFCTLWSCDQSMLMKVWTSACLCRSLNRV